jgi:excisionase family DNA binding protein
METSTHKADPVMTIDEVAEYLHIHTLTARRLAREGAIPAFKVGRQWRIKRALLDRWMERELGQNVRGSDK